MDETRFIHGTQAGDKAVKSYLQISIFEYQLLINHLTIQLRIMYKIPFFFRQDGLLKKIDLDEIIYLEAAKNYTKIFTADKMYIARVTLVEALDLLPENKFLRVHRSFAVASDHIDVVARDAVRLTTIRVEVPVSRMYYVELTKKVIILDSAAFETGRKRTVKGRTKRTSR